MKTSVGWNMFLWSREQGRGRWGRSASTWYRPEQQRQERGSVLLWYYVLEEKTCNHMQLTGIRVNGIKVGYVTMKASP